MCRLIVRKYGNRICLFHSILTYNIVWKKKSAANGLFAMFHLAAADCEQKKKMFMLVYKSMLKKSNRLVLVDTDM